MEELEAGGVIASHGWCAPTDTQRILFPGVDPDWSPLLAEDMPPTADQVVVSYTHECPCCWNCCTNHPDDD